MSGRLCEALGKDCFLIVINPRGCAGSPLTTLRLFSAADSDDVSTAVQFINKARSGTTLVGVGWGYGAKMLTKYLAEIGENSPLTAATCIDNPFDFMEATKSSPNQMARDQQLTDGLIDILRSNKELFQGKAKQFDSEQALSASHELVVTLRQRPRRSPRFDSGFLLLDTMFTLFYTWVSWISLTFFVSNDLC